MIFYTVGVLQCAITLHPEQGAGARKGVLRLAGPIRGLMGSGATMRLSRGSDEWCGSPPAEVDFKALSSMARLDAWERFAILSGP